MERRRADQAVPGHDHVRRPGGRRPHGRPVRLAGGLRRATRLAVAGGQLPPDRRLRRAARVPGGRRYRGAPTGNGDPGADVRSDRAGRLRGQPGGRHRGGVAELVGMSATTGTPTPSFATHRVGMEGRQRGPLTTARLVVVAALSAQLALLAITGLWLVFYYRPGPTPSLTIQALRTAVTASQRVRDVHRLAAVAALPTSAAAGVLVVADARTLRPGWLKGRLALAAGPGLAVLVGLASFTGYLLPWDQLALWAVT